MIPLKSCILSKYYIQAKYSWIIYIISIYMLLSCYCIRILLYNMLYIHVTICIQYMYYIIYILLSCYCIYMLLYVIYMCVTICIQSIHYMHIIYYIYKMRVTCFRNLSLTPCSWYQSGLLLSLAELSSQLWKWLIQTWNHRLWSSSLYSCLNTTRK